MKHEHINGHLVRRRRQRLGDQGSIRAFARSTGLTTTSVRSIEVSHRIAGETPLHQLTRIADVLGVPVTDLLRQADPDPPPPAEDLEDTGQLAADLGRLGRLLSHDLRLIRKAAIATVFGWEMPRLRAAQDALTEQLRPTGMTVHEVNGMIALRPVDGSGEDDADRVASIRLATDGMTVRQAAILHGIRTGGLQSNQITEDRLPFLGSLMNLGIVYREMAGGINSYRLTPDAAYAFDV
jgi:hypothetical protein